MKLILPVSFLFLFIGSLLVANGQTNREASSKRIVFFGDSLTAGYGIDPDETYPARIQQRIEENGWNFQSVNAGLSGETSAGGLRRIDWILRQPVDVFVLALGANDGLRGIDPAETRKNLQGIIDRVKARNAHAEIVIAGMQMPPNMGPRYGERFAAIFPSLARENDAKLIPFLLEEVGGNPRLNLPDGIHPTAEGHRIMVRTVWETLEPVLQERARS